MLGLSTRPGKMQELDTNVMGFSRTFDNFIPFV